MNVISKISSTVVAGLLVTLPISVSGHHSMSEYDRSAVTELEGEVVDVLWRNPHILLWVETADDNGEAVVWELEGSAVSAQLRRGFTTSPVQVGDEVRVAGWPSSRRPQHLQVNHVLLPDGVELLVGGTREPRWSDTFTGNERGLVDPAKVAAARGEGIFRVWSQAVRAWYFPGRSDYQLTEYAADAAAEWDDIEDNPLLDCTPPGMPGLMGNPYPMEFVQRDGSIELQFEEFDAVRTIHMEDAVDSTDVSASLLGYSVGRWEGETLAVTTTRVSWPYFDRIGAPQTEAVVINERFTPVEDGNRLDYQMTVIEPQTLVQPFVLDIYFSWRPGEVVNSYDCTVEN